MEVDDSHAGVEGGGGDKEVCEPSKLWNNVNHIALVVQDVGRSVIFYADILGMEQVRRPDFDRSV